MTEQTQKRQGFFVIAAFDRVFDREKLQKDGSFIKSHYVGLILRTDKGTALCQVKTKHPEKYANLKTNEIISMEIFPRAYKDNIYYSDE